MNEDIAPTEASTTVVPAATHNPTQQYSDSVQAKIQTLRSDPEFMKRYHSDNPKVRALAIAEMDKLHFHAFGDKRVTEELADRPKTFSEQKNVIARQAYERIFSPSGKR